MNFSERYLSDGLRTSGILGNWPFRIVCGRAWVLRHVATYGAEREKPSFKEAVPCIYLSAATYKYHRQ